MLEVVDVPSDVRFTSTVQGEVAEPQVFAALHSRSGLGSEQAYLLPDDWAVAKPAENRSNTMSDGNLLSMHLWDFIMHPQQVDL